MERITDGCMYGQINTRALDALIYQEPVEVEKMAVKAKL